MPLDRGRRAEQNRVQSLPIPTIGSGWSASSRGCTRPAPWRTSSSWRPSATVSFMGASSSAGPPGGRPCRGVIRDLVPLAPPQARRPWTGSRSPATCSRNGPPGGGVRQRLPPDHATRGVPLCLATPVGAGWHLRDGVVRAPSSLASGRSASPGRTARAPPPAPPRSSRCFSIARAP